MVDISNAAYPTAGKGLTLDINGFIPKRVVQVNGVTGTVSSAGAVIAGSGYSVVRNSAGNYTITYATPFAATPTTTVFAASVVGKVLVPNLSSSSATALTVVILDALAAGVATDTGFAFHAIAMQ